MFVFCVCFLVLSLWFFNVFVFNDWSVISPMSIFRTLFVHVSHKMLWFYFKIFWNIFSYFGVQDKIEQEFLKAETSFFSENWHLSLCNIIECYFVPGAGILLFDWLIDWLIENFWISLDMKIVWWCSACPCIVCVWDFPSQDVGCCLTMCPMVVTCNMA